MKYFLSFSGGLDSTYCLWHHITNMPNEGLLIHYCHLKTSQNRYEYEKEAVDKIIRWLNNRTTNYELIETAVDISIFKRRPADGQILAFLTGTIIMNYPSLEYRYLPIVKDEIDRLGSSYKALSDSQEAMLNAPRSNFNTNKRTKALKVIKPCQSMYKSQMLKALPKDLQSLYWSCRTPKDGQPCQKCHTCKQIALDC